MTPVHQGAADSVARLSLRSGLFYGWLVVIVVLLVSAVSMGTRMASGVMIKPLESEFGWDRAAISLSLALGLLANGLGAPFGGRLLDAFGPRKITVGALILCLVATVGTIVMSTLLELTLWWGVVLGIATGAAGGSLGPVVANRWFVKRRGLVTGLLGGGSSAGQLVFIPLLMALTVNVDWRAALWMMAGFLALLIPLTILIVRDNPASVGLHPYGADSASPAAMAAGSHATPLSAAVRTGDFWLLAFSFFTCGFTSTGLIGTHFIPHAIEHGFGENTAANALAVIGAMNVVGTLASGYLTDRFNPRWLLAWYYGLRAASLVLLPAVSDIYGLAIFAVVFGLDYIATVPPTVALTADRFGKQSLGTLYGWIFFSHQLGSAVASYGAGALRQWLGDYTMAFLLAAVVGFIAAALCPRIALQHPQEEQPAAVPA